MNARNLTLVLFALLLAGFLMLNWPAITAPTELDLALTRVNAPLGIVFLGVLLVLSLIYLVYGLALRTSLLLDQRGVLKELEATRRMADDAEASRIAGLRQFIGEEFTKLNTTLDEESDWLHSVLDERARGEAGSHGQQATPSASAQTVTANAAEGAQTHD